MDSARIEDLKRRVQRDPASIAFAQLGEEFRRAGRFAEAVETCRAGLRHHPGYLSARVTLGRCLLHTGDLIAARDELERVLALAPENLAALRGLADIEQRRGNPASALSHLRRAAQLAPEDGDLHQRVRALEASLQSGTSPQAGRRARLLDALERWHTAIVAYRKKRA